MAKNKTGKKSNKTKNGAKKNEWGKIFVKNILPAIVIASAIAGTFLFLKNSRYFKLCEIKVVDNSRATSINGEKLLKTYKGTNIFDIDVGFLSSRLRKEYPATKDIVVQRALPDSLEIKVTPRIPVVVIKSSAYYPVDRSGMILSPDMKTGGLPVLIGFSFWGKARVGERVNNSQLGSAISLLDAIRTSALSRHFEVTTIDVSNQANLSFYLENGIEVKMGGENFPERLKTLKTLLSNPELDKDNIKYIDLRFKDVVIGPK